MYAEYDASAGCDPSVDPPSSAAIVNAELFSIFLRDNSAELSSFDDAAMLVWYRVLGAVVCTWKPLTYTAADTKIKTEAKRVLDEIMVASLFYEGVKSRSNNIARMAGGGHCSLKKCRGCLRGAICRTMPWRGFLLEEIRRRGSLSTRLSFDLSFSQHHRDGKDAKTSPRSVEMKLTLHYRIENQHCHTKK